MRPRLGLLVGVLALVSGEAFATCRSPSSACNVIGYCLYDREPRRLNDRARINQGIDERNGNLVWAGTEACARDMSVRDFDDLTHSCSDDDYWSLAKGVREAGEGGYRDYCRVR